MITLHATKLSLRDGLRLHLHNLRTEDGPRHCLGNLLAFVSTSFLHFFLPTLMFDRMCWEMNTALPGVSSNASDGSHLLPIVHLNLAQGWGRIYHGDMPRTAWNAGFRCRNLSCQPFWGVLSGFRK
eukprot:5983389-Amphidinium_carterae.2